MDDHQCLKRIQQGGPLADSAITVLHERYAGLFHRYLRHHGLRFSSSECEDILQETFLRLISLRGQTFEVPAKPKPWLYTILIRRAIDYHRRRPSESHRVERPSPSDGEATTSSPWEEHVPGDLLPEATLQGVLAALQAFQADYPKPGTALELVILEGWSPQDLAVFLERTPGATREYLSRWRKRWREEYLQRFCPHCFGED
ncbi:MAG: RNA polymerase sigma factor [Gammaproteobacteria bacterium]|nr:RNA polymerase sigma factor [Gammaproteobacteria bacterium]